MTPEELEEYENSIPEWKRNALVLSDKNQTIEEKKGVLGKLKQKINETESAKTFYQGDEY